MEKTMRAIGFKKALPIAAENSLFEFEKQIPEVLSRDLLVKVEAISVNPVDKFTRKAQEEELSEPKVIGYDAVGTVVKTG